jgi:hypothetical protein
MMAFLFRSFEDSVPGVSVSPFRPLCSRLPSTNVSRPSSSDCRVVRFYQLILFADMAAITAGWLLVYYIAGGIGSAIGGGA